MEVQKGIELFNKSPEKGMKYLITMGLLKENEEEIAQFLRSN